MANDLTKIPKEVILDLINSANGTSFTAGMLEFSLPVVDAGSKNTSLTVTAIDGSGYTGFVVEYYNRLHLTTAIRTPFLAANPSKDMIFQIGDATRISDIIPEINTRLGINLTPDDYIDADLPEFTGGIANESHDVQIVANADSLVYLGSLTFTLQAEEIELSSVITVTELDGLTYAPPVAV